MERKKETTPDRYSELRDPKLPAVNGTFGNSVAMQQIHTAPIPQPPKEL